MPNQMKQKGTAFEYDIKHVLEMLEFHVIRSYSSMGVADLVASPPWNKNKNSRGLLIQAKNQKREDYVSPFERDHLSYLQQINAGIVCIIYKDKKKNIMVNVEGNKTTFEVFIAVQYGIKCNFRELLKKFRNYERPIHLYPVDKELHVTRTGKRVERPVSSFADFYSVKCFFAHVAEKFKHL